MILQLWSNTSGHIDTENPNPAEIGKFGSALHLYQFSYRFDDHGGSFWLEARAHVAGNGASFSRQIMASTKNTNDMFGAQAWE